VGGWSGHWNDWLLVLSQSEMRVSGTRKGGWGERWRWRWMFVGDEVEGGGGSLARRREVRVEKVDR
jgi:hypothetical protein